MKQIFHAVFLKTLFCSLIAAKRHFSKHGMNLLLHNFFPNHINLMYDKSNYKLGFFNFQIETIAYLKNKFF